MTELIKILLVEDNPGDAAVLRRLLAAIDGVDFQIDLAVRLDDGLSRVAKHTHDLVFLDLTLPDSVGYQTFERMAAAAPDLPIIVMTSVDDATLENAATDLGVQDYIVKGSIDSAGLARSIRDACERKRLDVRSRHSK